MPAKRGGAGLWREQARGQGRRPGQQDQAEEPTLLPGCYGLLGSAPPLPLLVTSVSSHVQLGSPCLRSAVPGGFQGNARGWVISIHPE